MNLTRRELMKLGLGATALAGTPRLFSAATAAPAPAAPNLPLLTKTIPSTGEKIPVVGIGTRTYANVTDEIRLVLRELGESGCTMADTAPGDTRPDERDGQLWLTLQRLWADSCEQRILAEDCGPDPSVLVPFNSAL